MTASELIAPNFAGSRRKPGMLFPLLVLRAGVRRPRAKIRVRFGSVARIIG
jgi:hypothetical protein